MGMLKMVRVPTAFLTLPATLRTGFFPGIWPCAWDESMPL